MDAIDRYIAAEVARRRRLRGLTQRELSERAKVPVEQLARYERRLARMRVRDLVGLAKALGCRPEDFFPGRSLSEPASSQAAAQVATQFRRLPGGSVRETVFGFVVELATSCEASASSDQTSATSESSKKRGRRLSREPLLH